MGEGARHPGRSSGRGPLLPRHEKLEQIRPPTSTQSTHNYTQARERFAGSAIPKKHYQLYIQPEKKKRKKRIRTRNDKLTMATLTRCPSSGGKHLSNN